MNQRHMTELTDVSLITCIVQRNIAETIVLAAREAGAQGATVHFGKGTGIRERLGVLGVAVEVEKEIVNVVVSSDQVDRIFEVMYLAGKLDKPGMGFMYITKLEKAATYIPADVLAKISEDQTQTEGT
jgi:nitrogen regulatory protein P-II 1